MNKFIVLLLILSASAFHASAQDQSEQIKRKRFETRKAKALETADKRMANIQSLKSCIQSANDKNGLKACRKSFKEANKKFKAERKAMRQQKRQAKRNQQ